MDDWRRDGVLLIGDAAHTMSPAGAIGVNVAIATAAVAAQEDYPRLGRGPIRREHLRGCSGLREADVRTLHRLQMGAQTVLSVKAAATQSSSGSCQRAPDILRSPCYPGSSGGSFSGRRSRRWIPRSASERRTDDESVRHAEGVPHTHYYLKRSAVVTSTCRG